MISFFIPGEPPTVTAQQKGYSRKTGKFYKTADLKDAEQKDMAYAYQARPEHPIKGAVHLIVSFGFSVTGKHHDCEPKITRPDTDNMVKLLKDCLTRSGYWMDDAQVADETVIKIYDKDPGIRIMIRRWDE
jgi:Holliday junction resolvase RusA-like endonuclease